MDKIVELNKQDPTVGSVISRLHRHENKIQSITAVVTWKDGTTQVCHDTKKTNRIAYELLVLQRYALSFYENVEGGGIDI